MDHDTNPSGAPLVPGLVLGPLLGRGGHGSVWRARDAVTGDVVAVKVGRRPDDAHAAREAALLARVDHPHVVRLRNVVECPDGTRALVLDLAGGGSLRDLVAARGVLTAGETVTLAVGLGRTLADLHALGLVHGDLTPGNVLLTDDGRPLVADLGVSGVLGARDPAGQVWGTPGFADPADLPATDPARDVHALGAVVRFCLTGSASGSGGDAAGGAAERGRDALLALADLATAADPARRPDAAEVARVAWAAATAVPLRLVGTDDVRGPGGSGPGGSGPGGSEPGGSDPQGPSSRRPDGHGPHRVTGRLTPSRRAQPVDPVTAAGRAAAAALAGPASAPAADPAAARAQRDLVTAALLGRDADTPLAGDVTRRIRQSARTEADRRRAAEEAVAQRRRARVRRAARTGGVLAGAVVVGGAVAVAATTWLVDAPVRSREGGDGATRPAPSRPVGPGAVPPAGTRAAAAARPASGQLVRTVERLAAARARALRAGTDSALGAVDEAGSPAQAADRALLDRLAAAGVRLDGLRFTVTGVRVVDGPGAGAGGATGGAVTVEARVATSAHRQVRADGSVQRRVPAGAARRVRLVLVETAAGWRVRSVTAA